MTNETEASQKSQRNEWIYEKKIKIGKLHLPFDCRGKFKLIWNVLGCHGIAGILFLQWESENLSTSLRPFGQADHGFVASDFQPQYPTLDYTDKPAWECQRRVLFSLIYDFSVGDLNSNIIFAFFVLLPFHLLSDILISVDRHASVTIISSHCQIIQIG